MPSWVIEKDLSGTVRTTSLGQSLEVVEKSPTSNRASKRVHFRELLVNLFLPSGYPHSVTPDYLHFQIFNGLQALCSSISGLISSRAILEGSGVGNASASATHALLVNILQDIFSRLTTIVAAFYIGTSLFPEAKTYRIIADISNDLAITLDVLSPLLNTVFFSFGGLLPNSVSLRILALCLSGSLRSICSIAAAGSKTAMSAHFSTPAAGSGDLGDLAAKESSLETVLCLVGMMGGTLIIPYLTSPMSTYTVLAALLVLHLTANYIAVRGIAFRTLNRQRAMISWRAFRRSNNASVPSPAQVAKKERILEWPGGLRDFRTGKLVGRCAVGSSLSAVARRPIPRELLAIFEPERYVLWFDERTLRSIAGPFGPSGLRLHICLKEGHSSSDILKAWLHAVEVGSMWGREKFAGDQDNAIDIIRTAHRVLEAHLSTFVDGLRQVGWQTDGRGIMTGVPRMLLISVTNESFTPETNGDIAMEARKDV